MRDAVAATGPWDKEALCKAAQNGHEAMVRGLIEAGADVNEAKDDASPLYIAAEFGHEAVVRALIEAGADVNKAGHNGSTPLSVSIKPVVNVAQGGHAAISHVLRAAGAV